MIVSAGDKGRGELQAAFRVAKVTGLLMSVSKICKDGRYEVLCGNDKAFIFSRETKAVVAEFERQNGLYVSTVQVKNPRKAGFHRQD